MQRVCRKKYENLSLRQKYNRFSKFKILNESRLNKQQTNLNNLDLNAALSENSHLVAICNSHEQLSSLTNENSTNNCISEESEQLPESDLNSCNVFCNTDPQTSNINLDQKEEPDVSENLLDNPTNFETALRQCCLDVNLNHVQIKALLRVLRSHRCHRTLPKDSRTLLKTSNEQINLLPVGKGVYWHIGFVRSLEKHLSMCSNIPTLLKIQLSTDGLSLTRNNPHTFWPIQFRVLNIENFKPIIAGIYMGLEKPSDPFEFFGSLISEVEEARRLGGIPLNNQRIPFEFTKCKVSGARYENRVMVYLGINHSKRTDEEYTSCIDEDHQKGRTPLSDLSIPPVTKVPFDIMHLVYLGVTVRLLDAWFLGKFGFAAKLPNILINEASTRFLNLKDTCPTDFARRPRPLTKYSKFKATELRHFLLYAAPTVLYKILPTEYYYHFLNLHVAMRILTSTDHSQKRLKIAETCINLFIEFAPQLYTPAFMSYNIHALQHLVDDAKEFGPLENCSAFPYENNMPLFKKNIRNHPLPLQQFARRLEEKNYVQHKIKIDKTEKVSSLYTDGVVPNNFEILQYKEYKTYESNKFTFKLDNANCFAVLEDASICKIENILTTPDETVFAVIRKYQYVNSLYEQPIKSSIIGEYRCSGLSNDLNVIMMNNIIKKCYSMSMSFVSNENSDERAISILLHTF